MSDILSKANQLITHLKSLTDFVIVDEIDTYEHMGALIVDAILQSGIKYETVVKPRVERILKDYPEVRTTTEFLKILTEKAPAPLLNFGGDKPMRLLELTCFLRLEGVETTHDLRNWLDKSENKTRLMKIKGIKDKTVDYLGILAGQDTNAVDRHMINFLKQAEIVSVSYGEIQEIINCAADILEVPRAHFDHSIWTYMSNL
ncbi:hypothetical protein BC351_28985 [Paenibacillus ferrarius]|uniref:HhH-GPD domain-containing protein n=1 Tax=Paenibacillus ferrarius TaxID=1469647 RepID=A0A1V4HHJ4_9BACL|nr:hypothetical protein [Paenibacillus ferrarius]OPH56205.1 hypothetical protein BC351_28985 [Paenibacillus ferrarius]